MDLQQIIFMICAYLLGMAFAGSFLGRRWMGTADIFLHKILKMEVTPRQYFYWKYITGIPNPPKPPSLKAVEGMEKILLGLIMGRLK